MRSHERGNWRASYAEVFLEMGLMSVVTGHVLLDPIVKDFRMSEVRLEVEIPLPFLPMLSSHLSTYNFRDVTVYEGK